MATADSPVGARLSVDNARDELQNAVPKSAAPLADLVDDVLGVGETPSWGL